MFSFFFFFANSLIFTQTYILLPFFLGVKAYLFIGISACRLTPRIIITQREPKVRHMSLKESESREIIKMVVMLVLFVKVYKALFHI